MSRFEKLCVKEAIIVEGKYDKISLQNVVSSPIITTNGFRVFKDKETQNLIRSIADSRGILVMTDVDSSGFVIRNFLSGIVDNSKIKHCYIPTIHGKEKRKDEYSKEGILGVEGIDRQKLADTIMKSGATITGHTNSDSYRELTKLDFFELGLTGLKDSGILRKKVLSHLGLPQYLSTNAMITAINCLYTYEEFKEILNKIKQ